MNTELNTAPTHTRRRPAALAAAVFAAAMVAVSLTALGAPADASTHNATGAEYALQHAAAALHNARVAEYLLNR